MTTKQKLRKEADRLLQSLCPGKCEVCDGTFRVGGHHIFSKSQYGYLRYFLENIAWLCSYCHIIRLHSRGDPLILEAIKKKRGLVWWNRLIKKARQKPKGSYLTTSWYNKQIENLSS